MELHRQVSPNSGVPNQQGVIMLVWKSDLTDECCSVEVLDSPWGTTAYAHKCTNERMEQERELLGKANRIGHIQEEWFPLLLRITTHQPHLAHSTAHADNALCHNTRLTPSSRLSAK